MKFKIEKVMNNIKNSFRVYTSESDFKHGLAIAIKNTYSNKDVEVICEFPPKYMSEVEKDEKGNLQRPNIRIDIVVKNGDDFIPIELKYKTRKLEKINLYSGIDCEIDLKEQGAHDEGGYGFWRDVCRINEFVNIKDEYSSSKGYVIFLTNDEWYWTNNEDKKYKYHKNEEEKSYRDYDLFELKSGKRRGRVSGKEKRLEVPNIEAKWEELGTYEEGEGKYKKFKYYITEIRRCKDE